MGEESHKEAEMTAQRGFNPFLKMDESRLEW